MYGFLFYSGVYLFQIEHFIDTGSNKTQYVDFQFSRFFHKNAVANNWMR